MLKWVNFSYLKDVLIWKTSFLNYLDNWSLSTLILGQIIVT